MKRIVHGVSVAALFVAAVPALKTATAPTVVSLTPPHGADDVKAHDPVLEAALAQLRR